MEKLKIECRTFDECDVLLQTRSGEICLEVKLDEFGKFDCWNEAMDAFGWPDRTEAYMIVSLQRGSHLETMRNDEEEGWITYGEDPGFGMWDYSGSEPRRIKKIGE